MGIMDAFRAVVGTGQQTPQTVTNAGGTPGGSTVDTNILVPNTNQPKAGDNAPPGLKTDNEGDKNPLAGFDKLWQKDDKNDGKQPDYTTTFKIDPKKLNEAASQIDFTKALNPELLEKASKGDPAALAAAIGQAAQAAVANTTAIAAKMTETALNNQARKFMGEVLPDALRKAEVSQNLRSENPLFENPAVKPLLNQLESQLQIKYPDATAADISAKAKEYLTGFATEVLKADGKQITDAPKSGDADKAAKGEVDWEKWLS